MQANRQRIPQGTPLNLGELADKAFKSIDEIKDFDSLAAAMKEHPHYSFDKEFAAHVGYVYQVKQLVSDAPQTPQAHC